MPPLRTRTTARTALSGADPASTAAAAAAAAAARERRHRLSAAPPRAQITRAAFGARAAEGPAGASEPRPAAALLAPAAALLARVAGLRGSESESGGPEAGPVVKFDWSAALGGPGLHWARLRTECVVRAAAGASRLEPDGPALGRGLAAEEAGALFALLDTLLPEAGRSPASAPAPAPAGSGRLGAAEEEEEEEDAVEAAARLGTATAGPPDVGGPGAAATVCAEAYARVLGPHAVGEVPPPALTFPLRIPLPYKRGQVDGTARS
jgi:hypothetical protein